MTNGKKIILIIGPCPEETLHYKTTIRDSLRKKGMGHKYDVISVIPSEGNIAGIRNIETLTFVMVTGLANSLLAQIKKNCTVEVFVSREIETLIKNLT